MFSGQSTLLPEKPCTPHPPWAFGAREWVQGPMNRETGTKAHRLVTPHTNTFPALVGCGGEMAPGSAGPHPPVRTTCSSHCSSHLTDRTSFSTNHREGPAKVVTHNIRYGIQLSQLLIHKGPLGSHPSVATLLHSQAHEAASY